MPDNNATRDERRMVKILLDSFAAELRKIENILTGKHRMLEARVKKLENKEDVDNRAKEDPTGKQ